MTTIIKYPRLQDINKGQQPSCYGDYRTGNSHAERDCDTCILYFDCATATTDEWAAKEQNSIDVSDYKVIIKLTPKVQPNTMNDGTIEIPLSEVKKLTWFYGDVK